MPQFNIPPDNLAIQVDAPTLGKEQVVPERGAANAVVNQLGIKSMQQQAEAQEAAPTELSQDIEVEVLKEPTSYKNPDDLAKDLPETYEKGQQDYQNGTFTDLESLSDQEQAAYLQGMNDADEGIDRLEKPEVREKEPLPQPEESKTEDNDKPENTKKSSAAKSKLNKLKQKAKLLSSIKNQFNKHNSTLNSGSTNKSAGISNINEAFQTQYLKEGISTKNPDWTAVKPKKRLSEEMHGRLKPIQQEIINQAQNNATLRSDENKAKAMKKLAIAGVPEDQREDAFEKISHLISEAKPTLNFNGDDMGRLSRLSEKDGLEKLWDAPKGTFDENLENKRDSIERRMHGYAENPYEIEGGAHERPVYMGLNIGGAIAGAAPNYGGSYFVARNDTLEKSTVAGGDTFNKTFEDGGFKIGTKNHPEAVLANLEPDSLKKMLDMANGGPASPMPSNQYVEAQTFDLNWGDMESVVLDRKEVPVGSDAEKQWEKFASEKGLDVKFYDSTEFNKECVRKGIASANENQAPLPKEQDRVRSSSISEIRNREAVEKAKKWEATVARVTQSGIDDFMTGLGLVSVPDKGVSLGLGAVRADVSAFTATVGNKNVPEVQGNRPLQSLFRSSQPYAKNFEQKSEFARKNEGAFNKYIGKLKKSNPELAKKLEGSTLEMLVSNPVSHSRQYLMLLGDFRSGIDKGKSDKIQNSSQEAADTEQAYSDRVKLLSQVCSDPKFQSLCKNKKMAKEIGQQSTSIAPQADKSAQFFSKFAASVKQNPEGWIEKLQVPKSSVSGKSLSENTGMQPSPIEAPIANGGVVVDFSSLQASLLAETEAPQASKSFDKDAAESDVKQFK
jgi:hypothetical protein